MSPDSLSGDSMQSPVYKNMYAAQQFRQAIGAYGSTRTRYKIFSFFAALTFTTQVNKMYFIFLEIYPSIISLPFQS